jgi:hypothetical protein
MNLYDLLKVEDRGGYCMRARQALLSRRIIRLQVVAAGVLFFAVIGIVRAYFTYLRGPRFAIWQFISAIQQKDTKAIYALVLDKEKEKMGVTENVIALSLDQMFYKRASRVKTIPSSISNYDAERADRWDRQHFAWADANTG